MLAPYSNLDVIGDEAATSRNQRSLERLGLNPLPVFHVGSSWKTLEALCEEYPYIALGGMVPYRTANLGPWLVRCFRIADRYDAKFHGFGQTRHEYLRNFPWYSVDSSSWGAAFRYGHIALWDAASKKFVGVTLWDRTSVYQHAQLIREHGAQPEQLLDRSLYNRRIAVKMSAKAWINYEGFLRHLHGQITLRSSSADSSHGTHLYLALGSAKEGIDAASVPHIFLAEGSIDNLVDVVAKRQET